MRDFMASHDHAASGMDYAEHERTYGRFVSFTKWGTIAVAALLIVMALTLI
jgi:Bacterial aa3 type cytochrome c oxidase subunit IV